MARSRHSADIPRPASFPRPLAWAALLTLGLQGAWLGAPPASAADATSIPVPTPLLHAPRPTATPAGPADTHMTSAQCAACHHTVGGLTHPVQVVPTMTIPADLPLESGRVTCTTCHQDTVGEHAGADAALLRVSATGQAFCVQCHTETSITRPSRHPSAISQAHLLWPGDAGAGASPAPPTSDNGVSSCLACHDGVIAPDAFAGVMAASGSGAGGAHGHPVGVAYPGAMLRAGDAVFKTDVNQRVRLMGGQVTCNACHSLYSAEPGLLVMRNDRSVLCTSCHAQ